MREITDCLPASRFTIFSKNVQTFVRIFDLAITYRRTRDPRQINHSKKFSPEINSDQNLNGWSRLKISTFTSKGPKMSHSLSAAICPDTVLLFEPRMRHPALRVIEIIFYLEINDFIANLL